MQHEDVMPWKYVGPICSSPEKKAFATYRWRTHSRWQFALNPVVNSNNTIYGNVVSVPTEEHNIYIYICTHTSPLIPQVASVCLTLHGQCCIRYENVFTTWGRDHKTFLGPHALGARSWPVARQTRNLYLTIGTVLKQASSWGDESEIHITRQKNTYLLTLS
jgi:hypothetical protein